MPIQYTVNSNAPLQSWDIFCHKYNSLMEDATKYQESVMAIKQIARMNKWSKQQTLEAIENIQQYVILITNHLQKITFAGKGFEEMTGYTLKEAMGRNPNFLQGDTTNKTKTNSVKAQLGHHENIEIILENYRKNGDIYLCKIIIKPVFNINQKLVNFIAYEQELAA